MNKTDKNLSDFFGLPVDMSNVIEVEAEEVVQPIAAPVVKNTTIDDDYEYARGNLKGLIENGKNVIENIMYLAKENESPRAYEVAGQLIKTIADTNKDLLDLAKKVKDVKKTDDKTQETGVTNVNNTLFVGSTAELQKLIGQNK